MAAEVGCESALLKTAENSAVGFMRLRDTRKGFDMPPWLWIVRDKRFFTGPTIPYMLGTRRISEGTSNSASREACRAERRDLLKAMRDEMPKPACLEIRWCSTIGAHVVAWQAKPPSQCSSHVGSVYDGRALYYRDIGGHDFDTLFEEIWKTHDDCILENRLNRQADGWHPIGEAERKEIVETLANHQLRCRST